MIESRLVISRAKGLEELQKNMRKHSRMIKMYLLIVMVETYCIQ